MNTVLFDLDDTLLDFKSSEKTAIIETFSQLGIQPTPERLARYSEINEKMWKSLELGEICRADLLVQRFEILFAEHGITEIKGEDAQKIYEHQLSQQIPFVPGARELLDQLVPRYALYLVSNGTAVVQDSRIRLAGLTPYFQEVFISQRVGYDKPHPAFFHIVFRIFPISIPRKQLL